MLNIYTIEQQEQWNAIVRSFHKYDVYWLNGYVKAFQLHGDGEPILFHYENDFMQGMQVVMKRDIAKDPRFADKLPANKWFDFATPYGYGGWLLEAKAPKNTDNIDASNLFDAYEGWCSTHNVVSEFVRFHPVLKNHTDIKNMYATTSLGNVIVMDISSEERIWANLTCKNRCAIRKAIKSGIEIYHGQYPKIYEEFRTIYNATMDKDNADDYYYFGAGFYKSILMDLLQNAQVFYAVLNGKIIAASIILAANGHLTYHLSGSLKEYQTLAPTNLLLYRAALWGSENGCKTFLLGGGVGAAEDSLYKFKKSFYRGEAYKFDIGKKIFLHNKYTELCTLRNISAEAAPHSGFFPKYRQYTVKTNCHAKEGRI